MNSGKTWLMNKYGFFNFIRGKNIYSNQKNLNFPYKYFNAYFLLYIGKEQPSLPNCCFLIDELWLFVADSRNAMSEANKLLSYMALQSSKDDLEIYLTSQSFSQNDKRLKQNFHKLSLCSRYLLNPTTKQLEKLNENKRFLTQQQQENLYIQEKLYYNQYGNLILKNTLYHKAINWFWLYDTTEKIKSGV
jgi:hypothetical protein